MEGGETANTFSGLTDFKLLCYFKNHFSYHPSSIIPWYRPKQPARKENMAKVYMFSEVNKIPIRCDSCKTNKIPLKKHLENEAYQKVSQWIPKYSDARFLYTRNSNKKLLRYTYAYRIWNLRQVYKVHWWSWHVRTSSSAQCGTIYTQNGPFKSKEY